VNATSLVLTNEDVRIALGESARIEPGSAAAAPTTVGQVLRAAASDSAYGRFVGVSVGEGQERPLAVGSMALIFDSGETATRTFDQVAQAAHMRTEVEGAAVAVETVTGQNGLVSYWGYLHRGAVIIVLTLDTLDPQAIAMTEFRALVVRAAERLELLLR
jgi:hypothetical protein